MKIYFYVPGDQTVKEDNRAIAMEERDANGKLISWGLYNEFNMCAPGEPCDSTFQNLERDQTILPYDENKKLFWYDEGGGIENAP